MGMAVLEAAGAIPIKARVVDDGNLVTGGGVTSGIDVALHLVERTLGPRIAHAVEILFEYERRGTVWRDQGLAPSAASHLAAYDHQTPQFGSGVPEPPMTDIAGRWDVTIATPMGQQAVVYEIAVAHGAITGTATQGGEVNPLLEMTISGNRLSWTQRVTKPMKLTLRFDVMVDGDTMTGIAKAGILPGSKLSGSRRRGLDLACAGSSRDRA